MTTPDPETLRLKESIAHYVETHPGADAEDIAGSFGKPFWHVSELVYELFDEGKLEAVR